MFFLPHMLVFEIIRFKIFCPIFSIICNFFSYFTSFFNFCHFLNLIPPQPIHVILPIFLIIIIWMIIFDKLMFFIFILNHFRISMIILNIRITLIWTVWAYVYVFLRFNSGGVIICIEYWARRWITSVTFVLDVLSFRVKLLFLRYIRILFNFIILIFLIINSSCPIFVNYCS